MDLRYDRAKDGRAAPEVVQDADFLPFFKVPEGDGAEVFGEDDGECEGKIEGPCELAPVRGLKERRHIRMRFATSRRKPEGMASSPAES